MPYNHITVIGYNMGKKAEIQNGTKITSDIATSMDLKLLPGTSLVIQW